MVTVSKENNSDNANPLSKKFSSEMEGNFSAYSDLYADYDASMKSVSRGLYQPDTASKLSDSIERLSLSVHEAKTSDRLDEILKLELSARLEMMGARVQAVASNELDYKTVLRSYGIEKEDMKEIEGHFKRKDFGKAAEKWMIINGNSYEDKAKDREELGIIENMYRGIVMSSFEMAPNSIKSIFRDSEDYMKTVRFTEKSDEESYQNLNTVYLNLYGPKFVKIKDGLKYIAVPDMFSAASAVGSEGLLGHQGQFFITEIKKAQIPGFLAYPQSQLSASSTAALGRMGSSRMVRELSNGIGTLGDEDKKAYSKIQERFLAAYEMKSLKNFVNAYEMYAYSDNNMDPNAAAKAVYSITRSPEMLSETRIKGIGSQSGSLVSLENCEQSASIIADLHAGIIADRMDKKLESMNEESSDRVRGSIITGYWTKRGFEQYFDYLVEKFG
ncbi:MAG: hypothetical protein KGI06_04750 [Candidatus Micrarchaeota archaeon]|nr:hypothetical protein [Candidatus Micrarchaeota archaeon]